MTASSAVSTAARSLTPGVGAPLGWGRRYLMTRPEGFKIAYSINPYMSVDDQPDLRVATGQWHALADAVTAAGARVEALPAQLELPDIVYAMNLGLGFVPAGATEPSMVLSQMRFEQRRGETAVIEAWWRDQGREVLRLDDPDAFFESGDAFAFNDALLVGFGKRTDAAGVEALSRLFDLPVLGFEITHPAMYHADLAFCPLTQTAAMVCPEAFSNASASALLDFIPDPVVLTAAEALAFAANAVVVGTTVITPEPGDRVRGLLADRGLDVVAVDLSEFHRGGGSARCMTNPIDWVLPLR